MITNLAKYMAFSTFDLNNAYHQFPICDSDKKYIGFEANGRLYQFRRIPFCVTNDIAVFKRQMNRIIAEEKFKDMFPYLTISLSRVLLRKNMTLMWLIS